MSNEQDISRQLAQILYPGSRHNILSLGLIRRLRVEGGTVLLHLRPSSASEDIVRQFGEKITSALKSLPDVQEVEIHGGPAQSEHAHADHAGHAHAGHAKPAQAPGAPAQGPIPGVRRILAVASGKGGVGKSTVAVNLALALQALGNRVGLLDGDIHGPSVPMMMGTQATPRTTQEKKIYPVERYDVKLVSMGFFLDDQSPVIWRGPLVMGIIRQFLRDVIWGELDYLVVDLPPGTGDASLTLAQEVPLSGGVIVSTPQDVALLDVQRGIAMFRQVKVPLLGVIENMSYYECAHCGEREETFGHGGVKKTGLEVLGEIPIVEDLRAAGDQGHPLVLQQPDHPVSRVFLDIARQVTEKLRDAARVARA
ncbi:MAG: Mrp/NBP35 family ATP-binding protein [Deltaproteobacteria bacterium]|nr:Mrp/NBP35 family ATP-binding protein [Deltaproteobacteria bacterium]